MSSDILPGPLRTDPNYIALNSLLDRAEALDLTKELVYWIDTVDASALPVLARQFHVMGLEGWDYAATEAEQRALLKQAVELHRFKGTPWAVRQGIKRLNPSLDIEEWFEYSGQPFRFRLTNGTPMTLGLAVKLFWTIEALKNVRSKLEGGIEAVETVEETLKFATAVFSEIGRSYDVRKCGNSVAAIFAGAIIRCEASAAVRNPPSPYVRAASVFYASHTRMEVVL